MLKLLRVVHPRVAKSTTISNFTIRTFLSQAYSCNEIWDERLNNPIFKKVNLDILYHELDQRFSKSRRMSPVDVDVFANAVKDDTFIDELLDLLHKLRLTQDTGNMLNSTGYAAIRTLLQHNKLSELLRIIDDRINYGVFLDYYTGNILMDKFWKEKNFIGGCIVASQFMLQDEFEHPVTTNFAILHCYNYLLTKPENWPQAAKPEEPEEEVKIRVKYLRNPFDDEHFDLKDPLKIVGKTLIASCVNKTDSVHKTLYIIGLTLYDKQDLAKNEIEFCRKNNIKLVKEIVDLLPEDSAFKKDLEELELVSENVGEVLEKQLSQSVSTASEKDIANQCILLKQYEQERTDAIETQKQRLLTAARLAEIEKMQQMLKEKEQKLWFFENEEKIELSIEETEARVGQDQVNQKVREAPKEEVYVPPEIVPKRF